MTVSSTWPEPRLRPGRLAMGRGWRLSGASLVVLSSISIAAPVPGPPELSPRFEVTSSAPAIFGPAVPTEGRTSQAHPAAEDRENARWSDPLEIAAYFAQGGTERPLPSADRRTGSSR